MPKTSSDLNMTMTPFTEDMENQLLEQQNEVDAGRGVEDPDPGDGASDPAAQERVPDLEPGERKVIQGSPQDQKRAAIAARFKPNEDTTAFDGDLSRPENMYGAPAQERLEPEPAGDDVLGDVLPDPGTQPAPQPRMITRNVRGKQITRSEEEWLELASKVDAADSYLQESRELLADAAKIRGERAAPDRQHPDGQTGAQNDGQELSPPDRSQHPEDALDAVVEQLQFGDPKEAAKLLKGAIQKEAGKIAAQVSDEGHQARLFNNDLARSQKALADFKAANPDLEADPLASRAIEQLMYDQYREDIVALGVVDEAQIPADPRTLANWHRFYKVNGHAVRNTPDLLNKAKEKFVAWRGGSPNPTPQPRREQPAPRVQVNVDRDARRQAIPLQPSRAVAPRRDAVVIQKPTSDSDVVKNMRRARGQPVAG